MNSRKHPPLFSFHHFCCGFSSGLNVPFYCHFDGSYLFTVRGKRKCEIIWEQRNKVPITSYCNARTVISDVVFMLMNTAGLLGVIGLVAWSVDSCLSMYVYVNEHCRLARYCWSGSMVR